MEAKALSPSPSARDETPSQGTAQTEGAGWGLWGSGSAQGCQAVGLHGDAGGRETLCLGVSPDSDPHRGTLGPPMYTQSLTLPPPVLPQNMEKAAVPSVTLIVGCGVSSSTLLMLIIVYVSVWRWAYGHGWALVRGPVVLERGSRGQVHPFSFKSSHSARRAAQRPLPPRLPRQQPHPTPSALPAGQRYPPPLHLCPLPDCCCDLGARAHARVGQPCSPLLPCAVPTRCHAHTASHRRHQPCFLLPSAGAPCGCHLEPTPQLRTLPFHHQGPMPWSSPSVLSPGHTRPLPSLSPTSACSPALPSPKPLTTGPLNPLGVVCLVPAHGAGPWAMWEQKA